MKRDSASSSRTCSTRASPRGRSEVEAPGLASVLRTASDRARQVDAEAPTGAFRPLTEKQIRYARLDTHFLLPLMREQKAELEAHRRTVIVEGECRRLELISPPETDFDADAFVRLKGARLLGPVERQVLRELFILREHSRKRAISRPSAS
jgi:ribonuclease D